MLPLKIQSKSILIVDDDSTHLYLIAKMMNLLGYDFHTFINPVSALEFIQQCPDVKLLLTDIAMHEMRGEMLARQAKEKISGIEVIFITGLGVDFHEVNEDEDMILYKPFSLQELSCAVSSKLL